MKILLYNPNTSVSITDTLFNTAKLVVSEGTELYPMTAKKGFPYIPRGGSGTKGATPYSFNQADPDLKTNIDLVNIYTFWYKLNTFFLSK